ncbi:MAG: phosphoenolpyruvate--protein phosphotransferase [Cetobacterium sp.]|nr:phosphoenolpyruvate--protein phosphotransferase [Cetobacterium sp.]
METVEGKGIYQGIVIGKPYIENKKNVEIKCYDIGENSLDGEIERLRDAIEASKLEIKHLKESLKGRIKKEELQILVVHKMLLEDPQFMSDIKKGIKKEKKNAEYIVRKVADKYIAMFESLYDPIYKQRALDIKDISERIIYNLVFMSTTYRELDGKILIAKEIFPSELLKIYYSGIKLAGIILEYAGETSHIAILARAMEIPTLMGGKNIFSVNWGEKIILDTVAKVPKVITDPDEKTLLEYEKRKREFEEKKLEIEKTIDLPSVTLDGEKINLYINIGGRLDITEINRKKPEGIGLLRTELIYMENDEFPSQDKQTKIYGNISEEFGLGKPMVIRTLDIGADKSLPYYTMEPEENPSLGCRGLRFTLSNREIFKTQIKAILRAAYGKNIKMMHPMVSNIRELQEAKKVVEECKLELSIEGVPFKEDIETGIMIEVPSVVLIADTFAKEVDFFSIGTNDLTQYVLATDRFAESVHDIYNSLNPAVLKAIRMVAEAGEKYNKKVSVCGEMAGEEVSALALIAMGIKYLSMIPSSVPKLRSLIRKVNYKELEKLREPILQCRSAKEVREILEEYLNNL